jgi:hypothetical protein
MCIEVLKIMCIYICTCIYIHTYIQHIYMHIYSDREKIIVLVGLSEGLLLNVLDLVLMAYTGLSYKQE